MDYPARIIRNDVLKGPYRRIEFEAPEIARAASPGQFVHVRILSMKDRILRRPFSICDADPENGTLTLVYKVIGAGTAILAEHCAGEICDILGPLGRGYSHETDCDPIYVAGGYGAASTFLLAKRLGRGAVLMGARTADDLLLVDEYQKAGLRVLVATNDGSAGVRGVVTDLLKSSEIELSARTMLFACGPNPMLHALGAFALSRGIRCELSLDHPMCCGVGACFACVIKVKDAASETGWRYSRTCKEGPVYSAQEVYYE